MFQVWRATWYSGLFDTPEGREALKDYEWFVELAYDEDYPEGTPLHERTSTDPKHVAFREEYLPWLWERLREFVGDRPPEDFKFVYEWDWELDYPDQAEEYPEGLKGMWSGRFWHNGELALRIPFKIVGSSAKSEYEIVDGKHVYCGTG